MIGHLMKKNNKRKLFNDIKEIKIKLNDILDRLEKLEYHGTVQYGELYHVGRAEKQVYVKLHKKDTIDNK